MLVYFISSPVIVTVASDLREFVDPVADSGTSEEIASGTSRHHGQAIQRLVMARRPRNDFRGSISGTAVLGRNRSGCQALFCGGMKGEVQHVCNPDGPSAIFLSGRVYQVPSRVVLEFGDAISGISRVSGQAARSIG